MMRLDQMGTTTSEEHGSTALPSGHVARHSLEGSPLYSEGSGDAAAPASSSRPTSLQSSYSTNDLPTVKGNGFKAAATPPKIHSEQFHQHNASMGRIPANAVNNRQPKESPESDEAKLQSTQAPQTTLQANAAPFGPQMASAGPSTNIPISVNPSGLSGFHTPFYGYGLQPYAGPPGQGTNQMPGFTTSTPYGAYSNYASGYRFNDAVSRGGVGPRRPGEGESTQLTRFTNYPLEHYQGELYSLCKDQHGCRYLQRKLEDRNPEHVRLIFSETYQHVIELMTGMKL